MRNLEQQITMYAAYHRDRRNVATHFVGVPMIVLAVLLLLWPLGAGWANAAVAAYLVSSAYYLVLDRPLGLAMALVHGSLLAAAAALAAYTSPILPGVALFVVGWAIQFWGHKFEGRKPAFVDDIMGLAIGPLFLVTEAAFAMGLKAPLRAAVERAVGPLRIRGADLPQGA